MEGYSMFIDWTKSLLRYPFYAIDLFHVINLRNRLWEVPAGSFEEIDGLTLKCIWKWKYKESEAVFTLEKNKAEDVFCLISKLTIK